MDRWHYADPAYRAQANYLPETDGNKVFAGVQARFASEIATGRMELVRQDSAEAAQHFPPGSLDWVYLDADHTYNAVRQELDLYAARLKPDGLLLGHDFLEVSHPAAESMGFGVVDAVRDFVRGSSFSFLALTSDTFSTFCLTREPKGPMASHLIDTMLISGTRVIKFPDPERIRMHWATATTSEKMIPFRWVQIVD